LVKRIQLRTLQQETVPAETVALPKVLLSLLEKSKVNQVFVVDSSEIGHENTFPFPNHQGIRFVRCQSTVMAIYIAAGYAKSTGRPAPVILQEMGDTQGILCALQYVKQEGAPVVPILCPREVQGRGSITDEWCNALFESGLAQHHEVCDYSHYDSHMVWAIQALGLLASAVNWSSGLVVLVLPETFFDGALSGVLYSEGSLIPPYS